MTYRCPRLGKEIVIAKIHLGEVKLCSDKSPFECFFERAGLVCEVLGRAAAQKKRGH